ncbi:MAG TPA: spore coat U domain-containing protein [Ramlibacter sp.]|nr:spore coat U domain-containing protein [Ramlibacter sp.]
MSGARLFRWLAALGLAAAAAAAQAGGCTLSSSGLAFGAYQPLTFSGKLLSDDRTSDASISIVCTGIVAGGSYSIALGPSLAGASSNPRYLANVQGGPNMAFNIFREPTHTTVWGDGGTGGLLTGSIAAGDSNQSHSVYGKIPGGQNTVRAGSFTGTMTMTLTYNP